MSTETDRNHNGKTGSQRKEITTASKRGAELSQNTVWLNQKKKISGHTETKHGVGSR